MRLPLLSIDQKRTVIDIEQSQQLNETIELIKNESRLGRYEDSGAHARGLYSLGKPWLYNDSFAHRLLRVRLLERSLSSSAIKAVNLVIQEVFPGEQFSEDEVESDEGLILGDASSYTVAQPAGGDQVFNIHYALVFNSIGRVWGSYRRAFSHQLPVGDYTVEEAEVLSSFYREQPIDRLEMMDLVSEVQSAVTLERQLRAERGE